MNESILQRINANSARIDEIERYAKTVDERDGDEGGGGGVLVKITNVHPDSPASGVRIFQGDVYGDGSTATATEQDVTIRIAGIAADVTTFPTGFLLAATTDQEWTGESIDPATGTNTVYNETVYEVTPFRLWA